MFADLSARMKVDEEATARLRKEWDELLQREVAACERAGKLLAELETERDLKLKAEERSTVFQQKADQDVAVIDRLRKERDELHRTKDRLRSERSTTREERGRAI